MLHLRFRHPDSHIQAFGLMRFAGRGTGKRINGNKEQSHYLKKRRFLNLFHMQGFYWLFLINSHHMEIKTRASNKAANPMVMIRIIAESRRSSFGLLLFIPGTFFGCIKVMP